MFIPQRILHAEFPITGIFGITNREAIELAVSGDLPAYYLIATGFDLIGGSMCGPEYIVGSYGSFHGALALLPRGILQYLEAQGSMTFDCATMIQVEGFYSIEFGPPASPEAVRIAFEKEDFFWLGLDKGTTFELTLSRVIFMREDLEKLASFRPPPKSEPCQSDAALGANIRRQRRDFAARNREATDTREKEYERWRGSAAQIQQSRVRPASIRELAELVKLKLELPDSIETIRKRI